MNEQARSGFYRVSFIFVKILFTKEQSGSLAVARPMCGKRETPPSWWRAGGILILKEKDLSVVFINLQCWQATGKKTPKVAETSILKAGFSVCIEHVSVFWHVIQQEGGNRPS